MAARRMERLIHDEIEESNGSSELRNAIFESVLLGTGIVKVLLPFINFTCI